MTTAEPASLPMRILNKSPEYFRSTNSPTHGSESRRKTAAERLEADKRKYYMKSDKVRPRRATTEIHTTLKTENAENRFTETASQPTVTDDDVCDHVVRDVTRDDSQSRDGRSVKANRGLNRSNTDVDARSRLRLLNTGRFRGKSGQNAFKGGDGPPAENKGGRSRSPREGRSGKSLASYLNKAKEGLKAVTSTIAGGTDNADATRSRQSRSAVAKSSKCRSSSVGANQYRVNKDAPSETQKLNPCTEAGMLSPRTQLRQARHNLKKVGLTKSDGGRNPSPAHHRGKTFTIIPRLNNENRGRIETEDEEESWTVKSPRALGRSLSMIENKAVKEAVGASMNENATNKRENAGDFVRRRKPSFENEEAAKATKPSNGSASARLLSSQRLKRRSLDATHSVDSNLLTEPPKPQATPNPPPDPAVVQATPLSSLPQAQKRKSWSRLPPSTSEVRRNESRVSFHEDTYLHRPGTRKSFTEALEEVLTPLEDDDMDTAYHSMSPDASMDCKTLVGPGSSYGERSSTAIAENINTALQGVKEADNLLRSKTPDSLRSKTPTGDDGISFGANGVTMATRDSPERFKDSSPDSLGRHGNRPDERYQWLNANDVADASQPLNRIDLAPGQEVNAGLSHSPMLAPRSRREVAPDCTESASPSRNVTRDDYVNTMRSQNTSSSASGDINKPLTALTASDLKPRRGKVGATGHYYAPVKPTCPYPVNNYRGSPKRHGSTPTSPMSSPSKEVQHPHPSRMPPSHASRSSSSSTPYSSLKRNRQRSKSDVSIFQNELDRFFSTMGMDELTSPLLASRDQLFTTAHVSSESDFSFAGASAYVRDGPDESMEVDPATAGLASAPSVSIIEKNARVMRWLMGCKKNLPPTAPMTPHAQIPPPSQPHRNPVPHCLPSNPPPIPPRVTSHQAQALGVPKESDV